MSNKPHLHIVKYQTYFRVLLVLLALTFLSVAVTRIELGQLAVVGALVLATIKSTLILWYFMHLKYESKIIRLMVVLVLYVFITVMIVTFFDYAF